MKKIIAMLLVALFVCGALAACGGSKPADNNNNSAATADQKKSDFKAGFIFLHDENSTYDLNFINAAKAACENLGVECILKTNIDESNACKETALDLVDQGCGFVFRFSLLTRPVPWRTPRSSITITMLSLPSTKAVTSPALPRVSSSTR